MTKQKSNKSAASRFKITSRGKLVHRSHHIRHLKTNKTNRQLRRLKQMKVVKGTIEKKVKRLLGKM